MELSLETSLEQEEDRPTKAPADRSAAVTVVKRRQHGQREARVAAPMHCVALPWFC